MSTHDDQAQNVPFDKQTRAELLASKARIEGRIRATRFDLQAAQREHNREEVDRLRLRLSKLKGAAIAAGTELAIRNAQRNEARTVERDFFVEARRRLPPETFSQLLDAVTA